MCNIAQLANVHFAATLLLSGIVYVLAHGRRTTAAGIVSAVVTTSSIERLSLRVGDEAVALFKATEVMVAKLG